MTGTNSRSGERVELRGCDLFELADSRITRKDAFRKQRRPEHD